MWLLPQKCAAGGEEARSDETSRGEEPDKGIINGVGLDFASFLSLVYQKEGSVGEGENNDKTEGRSGGG